GPSSAKQAAMQKCRGQTKRVCRIYSVGMDVIWPAGFPPLPLPADIHAEPLGSPLVTAEIPLLSDKLRRELDMTYTAVAEHKALSIDKSRRYHVTSGRSTRAEATRLTVERCAAIRLAPCLLISVDGMLTVRIPKVYRISGLFMLTA